jgi:hypothetical protein
MFKASRTPRRPLEPVFDTGSVLHLGYELGHNITSNYPDVSCDWYALVGGVLDNESSSPLESTGHQEV